MTTATDQRRITEVYDRANALLDELGITWTGKSLRDIGYTVEFNNRSGSLGLHYSVQKKIAFSKKYCIEKGLEVMEDVIRHEIAHALDFLDGGFERSRTGHGRIVHGRKWKMWATRCGANPTRLYEGVTIERTGRYKGSCSTCDYTITFQKRVSRIYVCPTCIDPATARKRRLAMLDTMTGKDVTPVKPNPSGFETSTSNLSLQFNKMFGATTNQTTLTMPVRTVKQKSKYTGTCTRCSKTYPFHRKLTRKYVCTCRGPLTITQNR